MDNISIDDVKKELSSYIQDKKLIDGIDEEIEDYRTKATSATSELSDMPKGSKKIYDKIAEYTAMIVDLQYKKIDEKIYLEKKRAEIENNINKIEQPYKNILYFKYILNKNLTEVSSAIGYEYKHTCKLHGTALINYQILKNTTKKVECDK